MNKDDIIKMAKEYADEVTNSYGVVTYEFDLYGLEKFALLIRAAEREACAKLQPDLAQVGEVGVWGERQWQGLTDEQVKQIEMSASSTLSAIYLAEAQLKGKNT